MKFGILSDVHGNLEALEVALNFLDKARVDDILFLGDAVGYGPNPNEVCALLRERCVHSVIGNHDAAAIGTLDTTWFHRAAAAPPIIAEYELAETTPWPEASTRAPRQKACQALCAALPHNARSHDESARASLRQRNGTGGTLRRP